MESKSISLANVNASLTMDSREIAELTGKRHDNVVRDIENQLGQLEGGLLKFEDTYINKQNGQVYACYRLPYRETMILVSGYSVELRAKVIDRWMELETATAPRVPKTFAEALRLAAEQQERIEAQGKQIEELVPKAEFFDTVAGSKGAVSMQDVAKVLDYPGMGRNNLFAFLREQGILDKKNRPYQQFVDQGYFRLIEQSYEVEGETQISFRTLVYQKGVDFIRRVLDAKGHTPQRSFGFLQ